MAKRILILEDNPNSGNLLKNLIHGIDPTVFIYLAEEIESAYRIAIERNIDIFLIDIVLHPKDPGDVTGVRFAEHIREMERYLFTPIIFMAAMGNMELYAYRKFHCYGYIEKPFIPEETVPLLKSVLQYKETHPDNETIYFRKGKILYPVKSKEILFTQNHNHYMEVNRLDQSLLIIPYKTCKQFLTEIRTDSLLQVNRNTIVNKEYITSFDPVNRYLVLRDQYRLDIGKVYLKMLERELQ